MEAVDSLAEPPIETRSPAPASLLSGQIWVAIMVPGPLLGGWLATRFGIPTVLNGQPGYIPTPIIFQAAGLLTLLAAIPLLIVRREESR
jgi:hypothetical protein